MPYKGFYRIKNPHKYKGDPTKCVFRSLWERKFMKYCDHNKKVLMWSSEEIQIPYKSPWDGRWHRYFVDFWVRVDVGTGLTEEYLIEIKPEKQTKAPLVESKKKLTVGDKKKIITFSINTSKWKAAKEYCADRGWKFLLLTEKTLFGKKNG